MKSMFYIPKKIKVGFNERSDTYTKKLGYVIYYDDKGVLRKEKSWSSWRDNKIEPIECTNIPTAGFVLNRKAGGCKYDYNVRQTYVRVYDPRGFEFEITIPNLLLILQETTSVKGKGLEGDFVYAWCGTELILLPVDSDTYRESVGFTDVKNKNIKASDLHPGCMYRMKNMSSVMYLGKLHFSDYSVWYWDKYVHIKPCGISHVIADLSKPLESRYIVLNGIKAIGERITTDPSPDFADTYTEFTNSDYHDEYVSFEINPVELDLNKNNRYLIKESDGMYSVANSRYHYYGSGMNVAKTKPFKLEIKKGLIVVPIICDLIVHADILKMVTLYKLIGITKKGHRVEII